MTKRILRSKRLVRLIQDYTDEQDYNKRQALKFMVKIMLADTLQEFYQARDTTPLPVLGKALEMMKKDYRYIYVKAAQFAEYEDSIQATLDELLTH